MSFLKVSGTKIVDEDGNEVILRGAGLGGWMNMENFITGFPGCEFQIRQALAEAIGQEKSDFFFDKFLEYFFMEPDAKFFSSLGLNCIRIPFNYHHFEDDMNPRVLKESGFKHLDRVIELCAKHNIYTILDLHTAPGGQNTGWHSDHGGHLANSRRVYVPPTTPYTTHLRPFLLKKHRLAVDAWGASPTAVAPIYAPLTAHILAEVPPQHRAIYPHPAHRLPDRVALLARNILVSEFLVREWAGCFVGMGEGELDGMAGSFRFGGCVEREGLNRVLRDNAKIVGA